MPDDEGRTELARAIAALAHQIDKMPAPGKSERSPWQMRISDIIAIISLGGMIYAFVSSQTAQQTTVVMRLDANDRVLSEVKKNSDQIPMLQYQMTQMGTKQDSMDKDRAADKQQTQEIHETLLKMGLKLK